MSLLVVLVLVLQLNEVQQKMSRFHGLTANNPERKDLAKQVETECNSIVWQVRRRRDGEDAVQRSASGCA